MKCPHCGNTDPSTIEDNGCRPRDPDFTLLCLAPCEPGEGTFDYLPDDDPVSRVCGMQWEPNSRY